MSALRSPIRSALFAAIRAVICPLLIGGGGAWTPADWFADGEEGTWFKLRDFSTLFQDSSGTIPVTAVEQPVGLVLDKSQGLALGTEVLTNPNMEGALLPTIDWGPTAVGTFGFNTVFPITGTQDVLLSITTSATGSRPVIFVQGGNLVAGKTYLVGFDYKVLSGAPSINLLFVGGITSPPSTTLSGSGRFTARILAVGTGSGLGVYFGAAIGSLQMDNFSCKELAGNHITQPTAARRPRLSARINRLTQTEALGTAPWVNVQGVSTYVSGKIVPAATTAIHGRRQVASFANSAQYSFSFLAKRSDAGINLEYFCLTGASRGCVFDFDNFTVVSALGCTGSIGAPDADGYRRCQVNFTSAASIDSANDIRLTRATVRDQQFVGDGAVGMFVKNAQLEFGPEATRYQRVNTATDYDTVGFPHYLAADGVDDDIDRSAGNMSYPEFSHIQCGSTDNLVPNAFVGPGFWFGSTAVREGAQVFLQENLNVPLLNPSLHINTRLTPTDGWVDTPRLDNVNAFTPNVHMATVKNLAQTLRANASPVFTGSVEYSPIVSPGASLYSLWGGNQWRLYESVTINRILTDAEYEQFKTYMSNEIGADFS